MLDVVFENEDFLALNKPSGISVLQDRQSPTHLFDEIRREFPGTALTHRIDKGTSGLLLVAKNDVYKRKLSRAFAKRRIQKFYIGVVCGHVARGKTLTIDLPLRKGRKSRYRIAGLREEIRTHADGWRIASTEGYDSMTRIRVLRTSRQRSLVLCRPITGRTHQLRVHLAWIGHAIVGDPLYGAGDSPEQRWHRLALHCHRLVLPDFGGITAPVPKDVWNALE